MAMDYLQQHTFRHGNNDFWARVESAVLHTADNLANESPGTDARRAWAGAAYADPGGTVNRIKNRVANHWAIQASGPQIPDTGENALQAVVDYVVTTYDIQEPTS